jgi:hypothetical protein
MSGVQKSGLASIMNVFIYCLTGLPARTITHYLKNVYLLYRNEPVVSSKLNCMGFSPMRKFFAAFVAASLAMAPLSVYAADATCSATATATQATSITVKQSCGTVEAVDNSPTAWFWWSLDKTVALTGAYSGIATMYPSIPGLPATAADLGPTIMSLLAECW